MSFRTFIERSAEKNDSNIVLAFDFPFENPQNRTDLYAKAERVLQDTHQYLCAVKFNHHLVLPLGTFDGVQTLVQRTHDYGLPAIMDCKINDVGATNQVISEYYYAAGFDALIANPFIGWEEGLKPIFDVARKLVRGVILLVYMSHKGANEGYGQTVTDPETGQKTLQYVAFARKALKYEADGAIVGATYPEKIAEVHEVLDEKVPIFSPGIGAQGGEIAAALKAGAKYLIVGRVIIHAENPAKSTEEIRKLARQLRK